MWWLLIFPIIIPAAVSARIKWLDKNAEQIAVNEMADRDRRNQRAAMPQRRMRYSAYGGFAKR